MEPDDGWKELPEVPLIQRRVWVLVKRENNPVRLIKAWWNGEHFIYKNRPIPECAHIVAWTPDRPNVPERFKACSI